MFLTAQSSSKSLWIQKSNKWIKLVENWSVYRPECVTYVCMFVYEVDNAWQEGQGKDLCLYSLPLADLAE